MLPAAAALPLALDQARLYIQRLLSIINERNAQLELLRTHLEQQTELCKLQADRAQRAEAAARDQLLLQHQHAPSLSPADLAALNALPPTERDATWLRRVFETRAPPGPYELAGLYLDAFAWSGTAATGSDIVAAVARVFPGVQLVDTGCGLRFRGLLRAGVAVEQEAQARQLRTERSAAALDAYASAAEASSSSRPASPRPPPVPTAKRKRSPEPHYEPDRVPEAPTSKRVRTAHGAAKADDALDMRVLHDVGTSPRRMHAVEKPARSTASVGTQTVGTCKSYADAEVQANSTLPPKTLASIGTKTIGVYKTYAETAVQARNTCPRIEDRPPDHDSLLAHLAKLQPVHIPPDLPSLRVPRDILQSALPDRAVRIVRNLRRELEEQETFRDDGGSSGGLEYLGTYVFRPVCVGYSRAVHDALARAVLEGQVRVLSRLCVGDSDSECEDGEVGLSDGD